ncbi:MAG: hypothetical protein B6D58_06635 [candidate division Zixibacteria bacterium 4484_95]|nr:MAG: hypothetical protein B6D58_06635 [candidate division Zixibacteria bacterium 4484_95]
MIAWIPRDQRKKGVPFWEKITLVILIFIACGLLLITFYPGKLKDKNIVGTSIGKILETGKGQLRSPAQTESLFTNIMEDLGLGHVAIEKRHLNFKGLKKNYPCYRASWPQNFPFVWFTLRLQYICKYSDNLTYNAIEIKDGKGYLAWFVKSAYSDTVAEIELKPDKNLLPQATSISFMFNDFADFKIKEALNFIWLELPFGFILRPDEIPDAKLAKALKASKGQCILELPANIENWDIILRSHKLSGIIENSQLNEENIGKILGMFPRLSSFYFDEGNGIDRNLVKLLINEAERLKLVYIYRKTIPGLADSLVYSSGLRIKRFEGVINCNGMTYKKLKSLIVDQTVFLRKRNKGLYFLDSRSENVEVIASLLPFLTKLNIIVVSPFRNAQLVERL